MFCGTLKQIILCFKHSIVHWLAAALLLLCFVIPAASLVAIKVLRQQKLMIASSLGDLRLFVYIEMLI